MAELLRQVVNKSTRLVSHSNRLEDRIRFLSEKLLKADGDEFHEVAVELRAAIAEHIDRIRSGIKKYPFGRPERRSSEEKS